MRKIPLNIATLFSDLQQSVPSWQEVRPGSISTKTVDGRRYLYAVEKDGAARVQRFLGPADSPDAQAKADDVRIAAGWAKDRRNTVTLLKGARMPAPTLLIGRILEVLANAGLFDRGMTLVGTAAYQTYAGTLGVYLPSATLMTNDVDLSVAEFIAGDTEDDLESILKRADPTFKPKWNRDDKLPRMFVNERRFTVDLITRYGRGRKSPVKVPALKVSAEALAFQEYAAEKTFDTVALYNAGVLVRVPEPIRYAVHKLLVAQRRPTNQLNKRRKDLAQADEILGATIEFMGADVTEALDEARNRGKNWKAAINASLKELGRDTRAGEPPLRLKDGRPER